MSPSTLPSKTIAACATVLRPAERAIVRVSGPLALNCVQSLFEPRSEQVGEAAPSLDRPGVVAGSLRLPLAGQTTNIDAFLLVFRAPRSYTGEDLVEIHLPGAPVVVDVLLRELETAGANPAEPGEFTRRAVLNGRMQLAEAEATLVAIHATDSADLRVGARLLGGETQAALERLRRALTDLLADVEAGLDFSGEDIEIISDAQLSARLAALADALTGELALLDPHRADARRGLNGLLPRVALIGPTGSGKSTLFNRLNAGGTAPGGAAGALTAERAEDRHTTRDVLTQELRLGGAEAGEPETAGGGVSVPVLLGDLPGTGETGSDQTLEREAIAAGLRWARSADVLVFLADSTAPQDAMAAAAMLVEQTQLASDPRPMAWLWNKCDLAALPAKNTEGEVTLPADLAALLPPGTPGFAVSAQTGAGCAAFSTWLTQAVAQVASPTQAIGALVEHLRRADEALKRAMTAVPEGQELAALAIRETLRELEHTLHLRLTPDQRTEAMLDRLFARFCLGK